MPPPLLTRRRDLSAPLSAEQFDANVDNFDERITDLEEADPPEATSVDDVDLVDGDTLVVTLTDATTRSVDLNPLIELLGFSPATWSAGIPLVKRKVFPLNGSLWLVIFDHTTEATFDPGANDGLGHNYYFELLPDPGSSLPDGGLTHQKLRKKTGSDFDVEWGFDTADEVEFSPSTASDLNAETVAEAIEELEGLIADVHRDPTVTALEPNTAGTAEVDPSLGDLFTLTPADDVTLDAASAPANARITIIVTTSGTSSFNIDFGTNFKSQGALATGTVSAKTFSVSFVGNGTNLVEVSRTPAM